MYPFFSSVTRKTTVFSWLTIFTVKCLVVICLSNLNVPGTEERKVGVITYASGDYDSYITAMENYISKNDYYFLNTKGDTVRAGRTPYYAIPYYITRQVASPSVSLDVLTLFNIALEVTAIVYTALLVYSFAGCSTVAFMVTCILGTVSMYITNWSFYTLTDSSATSLLLIATYFLWKALTSNKGKDRMLLLGSISFAWAIMLRPYFLIIAGVFFIYYIVKRRLSVNAQIKTFLFAAIPLLVLITPWALRNYKVENEIILFQVPYSGYGYSKSELKIREMIAIIGEDGLTNWDNQTMASYFHPDFFKGSKFKYPGHLKNNVKFIKELESIKMQFISGYKTRNESEEGALVARIEKLIGLYKSEYPLKSYIINPIKLIIQFIKYNTYYNLNTNSSTYLKYVLFANYLFQGIIFYSLLVFGMLGLFMIGRNDNFGYILIIPLAVLICLFPLYFKIIEYRFFVPFYFFGLLGCSYYLDLILRKLNLSKN